MLKATVELFLSQYFLFKAVLGKYCEDSEGLFNILRKIFLTPEGEGKRLYSLAENELAAGIVTDKDFMKYQRMQRYADMIGSGRQTNAEWEEIAGIKGNALLTAQRLNLLNDDASRNVIYESLSSAATCGKVGAIMINGILRCEGILLTKNRREGIKLLSKAAAWNDIVSTLALLHYCRDTREFNMARLKQNVENTPFEELYTVAAAKYGEAGVLEIEEVKLLNKSFNSGVLKRDTFDPKYARMLNSFALYTKDKEKAVFSLNKELLTQISDLPLKLSPEKIASVSSSGLEKTALNRAKEIKAIARALKNSDLRQLPAFRPLCISCEDRYVLNMYAKAIEEGNTGAHVEVIDVSELEDYDFEPTANNVFVRSIDEDRDNLFLLLFYGEISSRKVDAVKSILQSSRRAKFHLHSPNVTLNLSAVLPICLCDGQNAKWLKSCCDEIELSPVTAEEQHIAVSDVLEGKSSLYGVGAIVLTDEAAEALDGYGIDTAEKIIDAAVLAHREKGVSITLALEMLEEYSGMESRHTIGFGGNKNAKYH